MDLSSTEKYGWHGLNVHPLSLYWLTRKQNTMIYDPLEKACLQKTC